MAAAPVAIELEQLGQSREGARASNEAERPDSGTRYCLMTVPSRLRISPQPPFSCWRSPCSPWPNGYFAAARSSTSMPQPGASFAQK